MEELEIRVYGRVQGVSFRSIVRQWALQHEIKGIVLNREDGSVEIIAQGKHSDLVELLIWIQGSPGVSSVTRARYQWCKPTRTFSDFSIVRDRSFLVDQTKSFLNLGKSVVGKKKIVEGIER